MSAKPTERDMDRINIVISMGCHNSESGDKICDRHKMFDLICELLADARQEGFETAKEMAAKMACDIEQNYRNGAYSLGIEDKIREMKPGEKS